ncbi:MAG: NADH-quinone oxidoreductase subunit B [Acetobacter sp.]|jgi:Ni,Fe-hydrogenase III small subunit|nr:NADH-quinone oxidoreductase subunit B [Acetobacter sp.]
MMKIRALLTGLHEGVFPRLPEVSRGKGEFSLFHVDAGGCDGCAMEIESLRYGGWNPEKYGLHFHETPTSADFLLITGVCTHAMMPVVRAAWAAMARPAGLIAAGACAMDGGPFQRNYATLPGLRGSVTPSLEIPGCPVSPGDFLSALSTLLGNGGSSAQEG